MSRKFPLTDFKTCELTCRSGVTARMAFTVERWKNGNVNRRAAKPRMRVFDANKTRVRKLTRSRRQCFHSTLVLKTAMEVITVWIHIQNHQICMQRRTPSSKCIWVKLVAENKAHLPEICLAHSKQRWIPCKHLIYWQGEATSMLAVKQILGVLYRHFVKNDNNYCFMFWQICSSSFMKTPFIKFLWHGFSWNQICYFKWRLNQYLTTNELLNFIKT